MSPKQFSQVKKSLQSIVGFFGLFLILGVPAAEAQDQVAFVKTFVPPAIGPGSTSTLTFTITNSNPLNPVTNVAFSDALPTDMTIASPAAVANSCGGSVSAPSGGTTLSLSDGAVGANSACVITVNVTAATPGTLTNTTGTLTSSAGDIPPATADLEVTTALPAFTKSFAPSSVPVGDRSTLTLTIDNSLNPAAIETLAFTDPLPTGMVIADPSRAVTDCGSAFYPPTLGAVAGSDTVSLFAFGLSFSPSVAAYGSCTVTLDVVATGAGLLENVTSNLVVTNNNIPADVGNAGAILDATITTIALRKSFIDDPAPPGGTVTLEFTITNLDRDLSATSIAFTDDLGATLGGLVATGLPISACGGTLSGTNIISLSGGTLGPGGSCIFSVPVSIPSGVDSAIYPNTTGTVSATLGGDTVVGNAASDDLFVYAVPTLTKEFRDALTDAPNPVVIPGSDVVIRFTIQQSSTVSDAADIAFIDELTTFLPYPVSAVLPSTPCGPGSSISLTVPATDTHSLSLVGGTLTAAPGAGSSCTFDVTVTVPNDVESGIYVNTTEPISATVDGATLVGGTATDQFTVVAAPDLTKTFTDGPVAPGATTTLEFSLAHSPDANTDATGITFTDDLAPVLTGLTAILPPNPDPPCGPGSSLTASAGNTLLTLAGGTLAPGETCTFSVDLIVPADAASGSYTNTTSGVAATVSGLATVSAPASDDLSIAGLVFSKEFIGDPVIPGDTVTLRFTLENAGAAPLDDATAIAFTDDLADVLPGGTDLTAVGALPTTPCGPGSSISGTSLLTFSGGELASGQTCTFDISVLVPAGAPDGNFINTTSALQATIGGTGVILDPATDDLTINSDLLALAKEFIDDPVPPAGTVTLRFTLSNLDLAQSAADIAFSDDLGAVLPGLVAVGLPASACGGTISGASVLTFAGGSLGAGAQCQFDVTLGVPAAALPNIYTNTTSTVTGTIAGLPVTGNAATDTLNVSTPLLFSKSFDGPTTASGAPILTFTITNPGPAAAVGLSFSDDLDAVITGLIATNLPLSDVCGVGSQLSGTSFLTMTGGGLPPNGGTCSFDVELLVPGTAIAGTYPNITSGLSQGGLPVAPPATADLMVEPPPTFAKAFAPASIGLGLISNLTFTIDNSASVVTAVNLDLTDSLPAGMVIATPPNAVSTCSGGTLTAVAGTGVISFSGGSVGAGSSCTVQADVMGMAVGTHLNTTGDLTSSSGSSGPATDTLIVNPQPGFAKVFTPAVIGIGGISTLTFTIDNTGSSGPITALDFTDTLPTSVVVATPPGASTTCTGGTLTAPSGAGVISYTGGTLTAGSSCSVQVDVTSGTAGIHLNTTGDLTSSLGSSGTASADLQVGNVDLVLAKVFSSDPVLRGGSIDLEFTLTNGASSLPLTDIAFTDDLDAALSGLVAVGLPLNDICGVGSVLDGASVISLTGAGLTPGDSCTFSVTLIIPAAAPLGTSTNTTSTVTALAPDSPASAAPATADFEVTFLPFDKVFGGGGSPGDTVVLTFSLSNPDPFNPADSISFTDDLDAVLPGLVAEGLPANDICGAGSQIDGTSILTMTGGVLGPLESCTFDVAVRIPAGAAPGVFTNTTGILQATVNGNDVSGGSAGVATDDLDVVQQIIAIPTLSTFGMLLLIGLGAWLGFRRLRG